MALSSSSGTPLPRCSSLQTSVPKSFSFQLSNVSACNETNLDDNYLTTNRPNLWRALRSVKVRTLFYSTLVAVLASLSFGYGTGFSSPALSYLENQNSSHYCFNKTLHSDIFNVSGS